MARSTNGKGGKGSDRRPCQVSSAEYDLRWEFAKGGMSLATFKRRLKKIRGA